MLTRAAYVYLPQQYQFAPLSSRSKHPRRLGLNFSVVRGASPLRRSSTMELARKWLKSVSRANQTKSVATPQATPQAAPAGSFRLETLPYEIRFLVFKHLGYTYVYLRDRAAKIQGDEVYYSFSSNVQHVAAFALRVGYKCRIVAIEYKHGVVWPKTTTVEAPGNDRLVHIEDCNFHPVLLHIGQTVRARALTLLHRKAVVKFGYLLERDTASRLLPNLTTRLRDGLSQNPFAFILHVALAEDIDKDARNSSYNHKSLSGNPVRSLTSSLQFIAKHCPLLVSLKVEPNHLALERSRVEFVPKLVIVFVEVVSICSSLDKVSLGLSKGVQKSGSRWVERLTIVELEFADVEQVHRLPLIENWVTDELGYLTAIPPHMRFVPSKFEVWS
jgi:hypothetical protein